MARKGSTQPQEPLVLDGGEAPPQPPQALALAEPEPRRQVAQVAPAGSGMALLQMAVERGADLAMIEKLMDLKDREEKNEAHKAFNRDMAGFKSEKIEILKRKKVQFEAKDGDVSYSHAELSDICDEVNPKLAKWNLSYSWEIGQKENMIQVRCVLTHVMGHSQSVPMMAPPDTSGKKNTIQQIASTTTYLQRYTLLAVCGLSTKGMDDDGKGSVEVPRVTQDQAATIQALVEETGTVPKAFLAFVKSRTKVKCETYDDIPTNFYEEAVGWLQAKRNGNYR